MDASSARDAAKAAAAKKAVESVQNGMTIGLGSGSTATFAIRALGERVKNEGLKIVGVPTSGRSEALAAMLGIEIVELADVDQLDLTIDGADEVDSEWRLIKGGGGALVREKLVACASRHVTIIVDDSKLSPQLGHFPLPVAVTPFGWKATRRRLEKYGCEVTLRLSESGDNTPFLTDDNMFVMDMHLSRINDPAGLEREIDMIAGVVEVGLFVNIASRLIIGYADGRVEERRK